MGLEGVGEHGGEWGGGLFFEGGGKGEEKKFWGGHP